MRGKILHMLAVIMVVGALTLGVLDVTVAHLPYLELLNLITLGSGLITWRIGTKMMEVERER